MSKSVIIWPYAGYSKSYKALSKSLGLVYNRPHKVEAAASEPDAKFSIVINWGNGTLPGWLRTRSKKIINEVSAVTTCGDKLKFFNAMKAAPNGPRIPEFTDDINVAMAWLEDNQVVLGRMRRGSCGKDIAFFEDDPPRFQGSEWWSLYKKKLHEFRIHIFNGRVISEQQKAVRATDHEGNPIPPESIDYRIRNHKNGFIFKRNDIDIPEDVRTQALRAVASVPSLVFGAVDVIYNKHENKAYVLEINTAPGLEGTTLDNYVSEFKQYL